ncbi:MAG: hypothetical protein GY869_06065, partial [Planctomycetes bacterium]|nr:hypothetical protein [Planctomycetota bacterium]
VELPERSISKLETAEEAGFSSWKSPTAKALNSSAQKLGSVFINPPGDGYVVVIATFNLTTWHQGPPYTNKTIYLKISDASSESFPSDYPYMKTYLSTQDDCCQYIVPVTIQRQFNVTTDARWYHLYGQESTSYTSVDDIQLAALYFPSWYGMTFFAGSPDEESEIDSPAAATSEMEQLIDRRVRQETRAIETRFEQRLTALKEEILQEKSK